MLGSKPTSQTAPAGPPKRNWQEIVTRSNGTMFFVPDELKEGFVSSERERAKLDKILEEAAEIEVRMSVMKQNAYLQAREWLEKKLGKKAWLTDLGLETAALDDGVMILNVSDGDTRPPRG